MAFGIMTSSITTLSIMTMSITTINIMLFIAALGIKHIFNEMLGVILLNVMAPKTKNYFLIDDNRPRGLGP